MFPLGCFALSADYRRTMRESDVTQELPALQGEAVTRPKRTPPWPTIAFLTTGGGAAIAAAALASGAYEPYVLFGIGIATLAAVIVAVAVRRPSRIWPWACVAAAFALFLAGGIARSALGTVGDLTEARSILPDLLVLPGYVLLCGGLLGFWRRGARGSLRRSSVFLDGLIAALALAAVGWVFVIERLLAQNDVPLPVKLVLIAYPSMSIFMVVVTLRIAFNPERAPVPAFWLLLAGMALLFVGDVVYTVADLAVAVVPAQLLDLPYAFAYLCAGACAIHPSMRALTEPGTGQRMKESSGRASRSSPSPCSSRRCSRSSTPGEQAGERIVLWLLMLVMTAAAVRAIVQALRHGRALRGAPGLPGPPRQPHRAAQPPHDGGAPLAASSRRDRVDHTQVALLYLDLDRFKLINDTLGHSHGDELLVEVADRLRAHVRPTDLVTRIGGDEFMILLDHVVSVSQAVDLANRLRASLTTPFVVNGMTFYVSASIGLAFASGDDPYATAEALVRDADTAMYQAKDAGPRRRRRVRPVDAHAGGGARRAGARPAPRRRHGPAPPRVPAHRPPAPGHRRGHGGARALVAPHARRHLAGEVHPAGRGERTDLRDRRLGPGRGGRASSPPGGGSDPTLAGPLRVGEPLRRAAPRRPRSCERVADVLGVQRPGRLVTSAWSSPSRW